MEYLGLNLVFISEFFDFSIYRAKLKAALRRRFP
jgi:hypothetical protein